MKYLYDFNSTKLLTRFRTDEEEVNRTPIELFDVVGQGAFGTVRKGQLMTSGSDMALEMVKSNK